MPKMSFMMVAPVSVIRSGYAGISFGVLGVSEGIPGEADPGWLNVRVGRTASRRNLGGAQDEGVLAMRSVETLDPQRT
jgi:hypothetical protein